MKLPSPMFLGMVYLVSEILLSLKKHSRAGATSRNRETYISYSRRTKGLLPLIY